MILKDAKNLLTLKELVCKTLDSSVYMDKTDLILD